jgi:hypothetical protein
MKRPKIIFFYQIMREQTNLLARNERSDHLRRRHCRKIIVISNA